MNKFPNRNADNNGRGEDIIPIEQLGSLDLSHSAMISSTVAHISHFPPTHRGKAVSVPDRQTQMFVPTNELDRYTAWSFQSPFAPTTSLPVRPPPQFDTRSQNHRGNVENLYDVGHLRNLMQLAGPLAGLGNQVDAISKIKMPPPPSKISVQAAGKGGELTKDQWAGVMSDSGPGVESLPKQVDRKKKQNQQNQSNFEQNRDQNRSNLDQNQSSFDQNRLNQHNQPGFQSLTYQSGDHNGQTNSFQSGQNGQNYAQNEQYAPQPSSNSFNNQSLPYQPNLYQGDDRMGDYDDHCDQNQDRFSNNLQNTFTNSSSHSSSKASNNSSNFINSASSTNFPTSSTSHPSDMTQFDPFATQIPVQNLKNQSNNRNYENHNQNYNPNPHHSPLPSGPLPTSPLGHKIFPHSHLTNINHCPRPITTEYWVAPEDLETELSSSDLPIDPSSPNSPFTPSPHSLPFSPAHVFVNPRPKAVPSINIAQEPIVHIQPDNIAMTDANTVKALSGHFPWSLLLLKTCRETFSIPSPRPPQALLMNAILAGNNTFGLMPTGAGKSLCYQLTALLLPGLTIVISPLISLMQDQVTQLRQKNIPSAYLTDGSDPSVDDNGERLGISIQEADQSVLAGELKLLYLTPEKLVKSNFFRSYLTRWLSQDLVSFFALDEAHCVSKWGHEFRSDYLHVGSQIRALAPRTPIMALTATATKSVINDCIELLKLNTQPVSPVTKEVIRGPNGANLFIVDGKYHCPVIRQGFNRPNLFYQIEPKPKMDELRNRIGDIARSKDKRRDIKRTIVYCLSRKDTEDLASELSSTGLSAHHYHGKMTAKQRSLALAHWKATNNSVMVATIAFGMGIDVPDVSTVVHTTIPKSLEGYYQECGRAGRDGAPSQCILFYGPAEITKLAAMCDAPEPSGLQKQYDALKQMQLFCEDNLGCRRVQTLKHFGERPANDDCRFCDNCLNRAQKWIINEDWTYFAYQICKLLAGMVDFSPSHPRSTMDLLFTTRKGREMLTKTMIKDALRAKETNSRFSKLDGFGALKGIQHANSQSFTEAEVDRILLHLSKHNIINVTYAKVAVRNVGGFTPTSMQFSKGVNFIPFVYDCWLLFEFQTSLVFDSTTMKRRPVATADSTIKPTEGRNGSAHLSYLEDHITAIKQARVEYAAQYGSVRPGEVMGVPMGEPVLVIIPGLYSKPVVAKNFHNSAKNAKNAQNGQNGIDLDQDEDELYDPMRGMKGMTVMTPADGITAGRAVKEKAKRGVRKKEQNSSKNDSKNDKNGQSTDPNDLSSSHQQQYQPGVRIIKRNHLDVSDDSDEQDGEIMGLGGQNYAKNVQNVQNVQNVHNSTDFDPSSTPNGKSARVTKTVVSAKKSALKKPKKGSYFDDDEFDQDEGDGEGEGGDQNKVQSYDRQNENFHQNSAIGHHGSSDFASSMTETPKPKKPSLYTRNAKANQVNSTVNSPVNQDHNFGQNQSNNNNNNNNINNLNNPHYSYSSSSALTATTTPATATFITTSLSPPTNKISSFKKQTGKVLPSTSTSASTSSSTPHGNSASSTAAHGANNLNESTFDSLISKPPILASTKRKSMELESPAEDRYGPGRGSKSRFSVGSLMNDSDLFDPDPAVLQEESFGPGAFTMALQHPQPKPATSSASTSTSTIPPLPHLVSTNKKTPTTKETLQTAIESKSETKGKNDQNNPNSNDFDSFNIGGLGGDFDYFEDATYLPPSSKAHLHAQSAQTAQNAQNAKNIRNVHHGQNASTPSRFQATTTGVASSLSMNRSGVPLTFSSDTDDDLGIKNPRYGFSSTIGNGSGIGSASAALQSIMTTPKSTSTHTPSDFSSSSFSTSLSSTANRGQQPMSALRAAIAQRQQAAGQVTPAVSTLSPSTSITRSSPFTTNTNTNTSNLNLNLNSGLNALKGLSSLDLHTDESEGVIDSPSHQYQHESKGRFFKKRKQNNQLALGTGGGDYNHQSDDDDDDFSTLI